ncbi:CAF1 family ribonuclease family protein [Theileria parva strain Muguga]|uniref:Poly(A)-specific ribonuclease PARN n=1 Tax=Theileria parva TaxID=5875 RepID=Q4N4G4_THEPA|nr:CAF1 family ribonuclease family protein [Theileria parva strain Muguga]EAN32959.1 CAF1 family ribonuclease family protein [Theileria parva strain Muguga]|eukprot:XP_765242.1 hypothetical protein [Theileria parva strain Muguga]
MLTKPLFSTGFYSILHKPNRNVYKKLFSTLIFTNKLSQNKASEHHSGSLHIHLNYQNGRNSSDFNYNLIKCGDSTLNYKNHFSTRSNVTTKPLWDLHSVIITELIERSDFVALDVEYTGLHVKDERFIGVDKCYESHSLGAKKFIPCQIGLTMAKYENNIWNLTTTSLFTIPSEGKSFSVNMSTLNFLKDNNFDFNSWIRNGITHLTPKEEEERKSLIVSKLHQIRLNLQNLSNSNIENNGRNTNNMNTEYDVSSIKDLEDRRVVEQMIERINKWIVDEGDEGRKPLEFEVESAFLRLLMHSVISIKYPNLYSNSSQRNGVRCVVVYKTQMELLEEERKVLEEELEAINKQIGLRTLFDTVSKNNKILVGHNCFYDILHIYQTFYGDLPENVEDFKKKWVQVFPTIFDTKYISEYYHQFTPHTTLKSLYNSFLPNQNGFNRVKISSLGKSGMVSGYGDVINEGEKEHEAGYDSLMTAIVFIRQLETVIKSKNSSLNNLINAYLDTSNTPNGMGKVIRNIFGEIMNSVRLVKCQPSVINMNNEEDMSKHFYMFGFPNVWKKWEIMKIWSPLWVSISWIDETSCWIIAKNSEDVKNINLIYKMMKNPQFKLYNYGQYLEKMNQSTV